MRRHLAVLVLVAVGTTGCAAKRAAASNAADAVGLTTYKLGQRQSVPEIAGRTLEGQSLSLHDAFRDKPVVLNVWASWCAPCRDESPMLATAARTYGPGGVAFVGIDEQDTSAKARAFVTSTGMPYPSFVDSQGALLSKLKSLPQMGIPSTLVLDRHAMIAARIIGPASAAEIAEIIQSLKAEH